MSGTASKTVGKSIFVPSTTKSVSPPRAHRNCSPNPTRRLVTARRGHLARGSARGARGGGVVSVALRAVPPSTETKIPKAPAAKGKENRGGGRGGARIAKPVSTRRFNIQKAELRSSAVLTETLEDTQNVSSSRAGAACMLKSRVVPDLHEKFLKKIRQNKRRSLESRSITSWSPCKAPASGPAESVVESPEVDRESPSPVAATDLQMYLSGVFDIADKYKSGTVSAGSLLECITNMVDLPKLDKWKLEELKRMLDPNNDNRYVDSATWSVVGKSWVEMMLNPDFHASASPVLDSGSGFEAPEAEVVVSDDQHLDEDEVFEDHSPQPGSLSFEGVGGFSDQLHSNREFELQNKVNELEFQLAKLKEEKKELENSLVASEEFGMSLTTELEDSHKRLSLSANVIKGETLVENSQLVKEWEKQCVNLQNKLRILEEELGSKNEMLVDNEVLMVNMRAENSQAKENEMAATSMVEKLREKLERAEDLVKKRDEEIAREIMARELIEERFEDTRLNMDRLKQNLSMKEEEIRNLTETTGCSRLGSVGSSAGANNSFSTVHDVSVDEKAIEAQQSLLTPGKLSAPVSGVMTKLRGPSASSTPNKTTLGSIAEELMNFNQFNDNESLQLPFCEKKGNQIGAILNYLSENIRQIVGKELDSTKRKELETTVDREVSNVKHFLDEILSDLPSNEEFQSLKEANINLEKQLSEAKMYIENIKSLKTENNNEIVEEEDDEDVALEEVANISTKLEVMADLLKTANSIIIARTEDTDLSLEPDTDVSGWQLDLEGIQLVEWQQRLVNYNKKRVSGHGVRSAFPTELSRSPVPGNSLLWQSLHKRLEDLQRESEMSRDLLLLAGDSLREHSLQSASLALTKSAPASTDISSPQIQTEEADTNHETTQTEETVTHSACPTDNCFCSRSQPSHQSSIVSRLRYIIFPVFLYLFFTFFCGLKIDHDTYYPVTWYSLRTVFGDSLPEPVIAVNYQTGAAS